MVDARRGGRFMPHRPREGVDVTAKLLKELGVDRASAGGPRCGRESQP
jgi:hypothetical protein